MAYEKTVWVDDVTDVTAQHMNNIENGIGDVDNKETNLEQNFNAHKTSTDHSADKITYTGTITPATNVKEAVEEVNNRVSNIIANSGTSSTEVVDARGNFPVLGDRLNTEDDRITRIINKQNDIIQWNKAIVDNNLDNMIIDVLYDNSNINASSTGQIYQYQALTTNSTATILWNAYASSTVPMSAYVVADYTLNSGAITYAISRDGGNTFTSVSLNTLTDISSQPSGTEIILKIVMSGNSILNAIGYGWL